MITLILQNHRLEVNLLKVCFPQGTGTQFYFRQEAADHPESCSLTQVPK